MTRIVVLVALWFLAGWMTGAMVAFVLGLPGLLAPIVGVAAALGVVYLPWFTKRAAQGRREGSATRQLTEQIGQPTSARS